MPDQFLPVTSHEQSVLTFQHRYEHCYALLGVRYQTRRLARCLMANAGGWSAKSLAYYTATSLTSVRRALARMEANGDAECGPEGWQMTDAAKLIIVQIHRECIEIAAGLKAGFSVELLSCLMDRYSSLQIQSDAANIDFSSAGVIDLLPRK